MIHLLNVLGLIGAGYLLWQGAELLVDAAARVAMRMGISELVVGLTIVAMGTSAPELAVSVSAALGEQGDVALGNVVGSNIFNLGVVLGSAALLVPLKLNQTVIKRDGPLLVLGTLALFYFLEDGQIARYEAGIFVGTMACYLLYLAFHRGSEETDEDEDIGDLEGHSMGMDALKVLVGLIMVIGGGKLLVMTAVALAEAVGMTPWLISVTIVAAGTSAPEMVTTLAAVRSGRQGMAIGGLFGSDIFNVLLVLGVAGVVAPMDFAAETLPEMRESVLIMVGVIIGTLLLFRVRGQLARGGGILILCVAVLRWILSALGA